MSDFSSKARDVLHFARVEAQLLQVDSVGTSHLLLGLLHENEGSPAQILQSLGVDLTRARNASEQIHEREVSSASFTPELRQAIHLAADEAQKRQQPVAAEHLFLALNLLSECQAAWVLQHLGINLEELRTRVLQALPPANAPVESPPFRVGGPAEAGRDKFTQRARLALYRAGEEAWLFEQSVDREHLFLGLLYAGEGIALRVLREFEVDLDVAERTFVQLLSRRDRSVFVLTPQSKRVVELAVKEAVRFRHRYLGTEHLLLGLVRFSEERNGGIFATLGLNPKRDDGDYTSSVLASLGLNLQRVRKMTYSILLNGASDSDPGEHGYGKDFLR